VQAGAVSSDALLVDRPCDFIDGSLSAASHINRSTLLLLYSVILFVYSNLYLLIIRKLSFIYIFTCYSQGLVLRASQWVLYDCHAVFSR
jgi:hypothetical protein